MKLQHNVRCNNDEIASSSADVSTSNAWNFLIGKPANIALFIKQCRSQVNSNSALQEQPSKLILFPLLPTLLRRSFICFTMVYV